MAVLPFTWLQLRVTEPLHGGALPLPLPLEIPPPLRDVLPLTWLALTVTRAQQVLDATASRVRSRVAVDLAGVEGQETGGPGEVHVVAVGDATADEALSSVAVDLAGVEGRRTEHVHDAAAAQTALILRADGLAVVGHPAEVQCEPRHAGGVKGGAGDASASQAGGVAESPG